MNEVERRIVEALEREGIRALNPPAGFPMEAAQGNLFPRVSRELNKITGRTLGGVLALLGSGYISLKAACE